MDKKYLNDEFDHFFEFPTDDRSQVSSVSAKLFAEHIAYPILMDNAQFQAEIAELKRHLAVYEANEARFIAADKSMHAQLAESQAREARLREALNEAESALDECRDYPITYDAVLDALALPHDDTALKEYRDSVIGEFVGKFKRHVGGGGCSLRRSPRLHCLQLLFFSTHLGVQHEFH